ncbi:MAG: hypothetical protein ACLQNE_25040 [Thermoguttaceae bacterium]
MSSARGQTRVAPQGTRPSLRLASDSIPSPPQQTVAWNAPQTKLSKEFISATTMIFQQGLADPRGCEYREIEVVVGGFEPPWSDRGVKTHGWVLPDDGKQKQRFGVCWNGLVYPLVSTGKPADLRADASVAAKAELATIRGITGWYWKQTFEEYCFCHPSEARSVSQDTSLPVKTCLLLRLGEVELAEKIWSRWGSSLRSFSVEEQHYRSVEESVEPNRPYLRDAYSVLANCWTLSLFDRAVAAHMRSDDRLALVSAETLGSVWPAVEAVAAKRGFARPSPEKIEQGVPYFLLDVHRASELLADQQRRAKERRQETAPPVLSGDYPDMQSTTVLGFSVALGKEIRRYSDKARRIDLLIRELEEITSDNSPTVLVTTEGEDAVEPLLKCLESDIRLTRRPGREERYPLRVHPFAEQALEVVLKMPFHAIRLDDPKSEQDESKRRRVQATKIRDYWTRYKGVPLAERWYRILADDHAEPEQWLTVARIVLQPTFVPVKLQMVSMDSDYIRWRTKGKQKLHGDVLRNKTNPSVTELMVKRIESLSAPYFESLRRGEKPDELQTQIESLEERLRDLGEQQGETSSQRYKELEGKKEALEKKFEELPIQQDDLNALTSGCDMAMYLAQWDPAAALPHLRRLTAICQKAGGAPQANNFADCTDYVVAMVLARAAAGDLSGLDEYAAWVRDAQPGTLWYSFRRDRVFEPLCRYPDRPAVAKTAEWLFNDKASPWYPILVRDEWQKQLSLDTLSSPLVTVPAFRKRVLQLLEDRQEVGHVTFTSNEKIALGLDRDRETSAVPNDTLCPPPGTKGIFRVCDACAFGLSPLEGTPKCELFWPQKQRDQAVAACAAMLRQYGHRFRLAEKIVDGDGFPVASVSGTSDRHSLPVHLTFPLRHSPATPDDVRKGEAIFSLAGQGNVRIPEMPRLPRNARWTTLRDYPFLKDTWDASGALKKTVGYQQEGIVWQAEEVEVGGRWQRYYGFVGRFGLAKVPAEEIEFWTGYDEFSTGYDDWLTLDEHLRVGLEAAPNAEERHCVRKCEDSGYFPTMLFYHVGQPMVFRVVAHNLSGTERPFPTLVEGVRGKMPDASIHMSLQLRYCLEAPAISCERSLPGSEIMYRIVGMPWTEVHRKTSERLIAGQTERKLAPAEYADCLPINLNRLFGIMRAGTYRLSLRLACGKNGAWQEQEIVFAVSESPERIPPP